VTHYTDEAILKGIKQSDNDVLDSIYQRFYPQIKYLVTSNSGDEDDAQDIFQEAVIVVFNKLSKDELQLTCSFKTYLYSVSRLLWLKQLEKKRIKNEETYDETYVDAQVQEEGIIDVYEQNDKYRLYQEHFKNLSSDCQKVLQLFMDKVPLRKIAEIMGYGSEKYAKKRKYICKETLVNSIQQDPKYKELLQ
jgi:RNA polymerase sigma factor (sigma-70 family)